jgi:hypothetical protein
MKNAWFEWDVSRISATLRVMLLILMKQRLS